MKRLSFYNIRPTEGNNDDNNDDDNDDDDDERRGIEGRRGRGGESGVHVMIKYDGHDTCLLRCT